MNSINAFKEAIEIEPYKRAEIIPLLERANRGLLVVGQEEMARSLEEKDRSLDEMTRSLIEEKDRSLAKKTLYNRILAFVSIALVIAGIIIISSYSIMNQSIYNNPLYWKGEGQATLLGIGQPQGSEPNFNSAIVAFNKSLEIANKTEIGRWSPQSISETWWLMGNAYLLLGNKFEREKDATASRRLYNKSIYCYKNAIDIYPLNYDAWVKKAKLENELNLSKDAELSSLQAIRINPNYGHQAWVLWTDIDTHQSELTEENSNNSLNNLKSLDSKTNSVYQFEPCCILPSNMSI